MSRCKYRFLNKIALNLIKQIQQTQIQPKKRIKEIVVIILQHNKGLSNIL